MATHRPGNGGHRGVCVCGVCYLADGECLVFVGVGISDWDGGGNMKKSVLFSSKTDDWATPQWFYDELNSEFKFSLDPCADEYNHKCDAYFTKEDDGLSKKWDGTVFCNPPYGREIGKWVAKAYDEAKNGCVVVMLIPARTDTKWFHDFIYRKAEIRFIKGRLKFGDSKNSAPFPSMVVIFDGRLQHDN